MLFRHIVFWNWKFLFAAGACLSAWPHLGIAQAPTPVILEVDLENYVQYWNDLPDPTRLVSETGQTTTSPRTFMQNVQVADIVAVNGQPAKGTYVARTQFMNYRPVPNPGQTIADILRAGGPSAETYEILQADGTPVGTIMGQALVNGTVPPGSPLAMTLTNGAVLGGTGAFLGVRGQCGIETVTTNPRNASQTEDPSLRRVYGGGKMRMMLYLIPTSRPSISTTTAGPAVVHSSDFTQITVANPAKAGEILSLFATDLGPVRPGVEPGKPFPTSPLAVVNSPVDVTVNGAAAEVIGAAGYPGATNGYQVNFRVPPDAAHGTASLKLSAAWISSSAVSIPIQ